MQDSFPGYYLPKGAKYILICTAAAYLLQFIPYLGPFLMDYGSLRPSLVLSDFQLWRLVSYLFLHDRFNPLHILFNMLPLWMLGSAIEQMWGTRRFVWFYIISGAGSGLFSLSMVFLGDPSIIGASGAILALLTIYAYYFPHERLLLYFIFPVSARVAVIVFGAFSLFGAWTSFGGIAHLTHLGGILVALLYVRSYNPVIRWILHRNALKAEKIMRNRAGIKIAKGRHFEEVIDPILAKISVGGMESLSTKEKKLLEEYSRRR
jgi:membrane associated rhomboid family serine protease